MLYALTEELEINCARMNSLLCPASFVQLSLLEASSRLEERWERRRELLPREQSAFPPPSHLSPHSHPDLILLSHAPSRWPAVVPTVCFRLLQDEELGADLCGEGIAYRGHGTSVTTSWRNRVTQTEVPSTAPSLVSNAYDDGDSTLSLAACPSV